MERPLEDTTRAMLWKTLFATVVELGLRSGLFSADELTPPLVAPTSSGMTQPHEHSQEVAFRGRMEDGTDAQELGEESEHEEDPLVEFVQEPDAEAEPGMDALRSGNFGVVAPSTGTSAAPVPAALMNERSTPSHRDPF